MQRISDKPIILLDVAHNPHSAEYLASQIRTQFPEQTVHMVLGMLHDKDIKSTIDVLKPLVKHWYPASLSGPRAASASELCQHLEQGQVEYANPVSAFESAMTSVTDGDVIIVAGSFHTVGEVLEHWKNKGA
jgi:dihydrofolate synthase/folylpolyglutamate synthase